MIKRFFRHIREGFFGVGRHAAMSVSSASAVTITLTIISVSYTHLDVYKRQMVF